MEPTTEQPQLAGWGARAGAFVIDNLLLATPLLIAVGLAIAAVADEDTSAGRSSLWAPIIVLFLIGVLGPFVYFAVLNGNERGQTLGKRATNIRVRRRDGTPLGVGRALGRYAFTWAVGFFIGPFILIDYLWPLWDADNQTLHDKVVDSIVVRA